MENVVEVLSNKAQIILPFAAVELVSSDLLRIDLFPKKDITSHEVKLLVTTCLQLTNGIPYPVIIYVGEFTTFSADAREYSATHEGKMACTAEAYIINNLGHSLIGNVYLKLNKPVKPVKFFFIEKEKEAFNWLSQFPPQK